MDSGGALIVLALVLAELFYIIVSRIKQLSISGAVWLIVGVVIFCGLIAVSGALGLQVRR